MTSEQRAKTYKEWQAERQRALPNAKPEPARIGQQQHQQVVQPPPEADLEHTRRIAALKAELEERLELDHRGIAQYTEWLNDANMTAEGRELAEVMLERNAKDIAEVEQKLCHLEDALQEKERNRAERAAKWEAKIRANTQRLLQEHPDWTSDYPPVW